MYGSAFAVFDNKHGDKRQHHNKEGVFYSAVVLGVLVNRHVHLHVNAIDIVGCFIVIIINFSQVFVIIVLGHCWFRRKIEWDVAHNLPVGGESCGSDLAGVGQTSTLETRRRVVGLHVYCAGIAHRHNGKHRSAFHRYLCGEIQLFTLFHKRCGIIVAGHRHQFGVVFHGIRRVANVY